MAEPSARPKRTRSPGRRPRSLAGPATAAASTAPRRGRPPGASTDDILDAAEKLFDRPGYAHTSLRRLMRGAGVSTTAFYARFGSKEDVVAALVERFFAGLASELPPVLIGARSLDDALERGVEALVAHLLPRRRIVHLVLTHGADSDVARAARRRSYGLLVEFLRTRLARTAERGVLEVADPAALAWAVVGAFEIHVLRWAVFDELTGPELARALGASAAALVRGLRAPGGAR